MKGSNNYNAILQKTIARYKSIGTVYSPYYKDLIAFTADGHHLQFSAERERTKEEQLLKFRLARRFASYVLRNSGTVPEYRRNRELIGRGRFTRRKRATQEVEYWGFIAIVGTEQKERVKVIVRRVGARKPHFWSIMRAERHKGDEAYI